MSPLQDTESIMGSICWAGKDQHSLEKPSDGGNFMATKGDVKQIWESWNAFAMEHKPNLAKTRIPKQLATGQGAIEEMDFYKLYEAIKLWIEKYGEDWWDVWENEFLARAKNNAFLQGKKDFRVTLSWLFQGSTKEPTPGIERALLDKFSQFDYKITANLNEDGSLNEAGYNQQKSANKGMKVAFEINE